MRTIRFISAMVFMVIAATVFGVNTFAQEKSVQKDSTVKITTSAVCEMCKERIEKAVNKLSGIDSAVLDVESKALTVKFDGSKTSADDIRKAVSQAGYDADDVPAVIRAYNKLPACCKKDGHE